MPFTPLNTKFVQFRSRHWVDEEGGHCRVVVLVRGYSMFALSALYLELSDRFLGGGVDINDPRINSSKEVISFSKLNRNPYADYRVVHEYARVSLGLRIARATGAPCDIKEYATELDLYAIPEDPLVLELREAAREYKQRMQPFKEMADVMKGMRRR